MAKPFHILLSEPEREQLEAHRARLGLRSAADVVRHWIALPVPSLSIMDEPEIAAFIARGRAPKTPERLTMGDVRPAFKSRLKAKK